LKKCQWISTAPPPAGWSRYDEPTVKLLGAHIRTSPKANGCEKESAKVTGDIKKHTVFFKRLALVKGPPATAILGACAVPKLGYLVRTHEPAATEEACKIFDGQVEESWVRLLGVEKQHVPEAARRLAALPCKVGGMGFASALASRSSAYRASREQARGEDVKQAALMAQQTADEVAALDEDPTTAALRIANAEKGTATWFRDPTTAMAPREVATAMRLRLGVPLPGLAAKPACPGCGAAMISPVAWQQHVIGCTLLHGRNASSRHAELKVALKDVAAMHAVTADTAEPRLIKTTKCPGCSDEMAITEWKEHSTTCLRLTPQQRKFEPHASGPDIRFYVGDDRITVDVTVVNPVNPSAVAKKRALVAAFRQVEKRKRAKYEAAVTQTGDIFEVIAVSAQGATSQATNALLARFTNAADAPDAFHMAQRRIVAAVVRGSARALQAAETQVGLRTQTLASDGTDADSDADEDAGVATVAAAAATTSNSQGDAPTVAAAVVPAAGAAAAAAAVMPAVAAASAAVAQPSSTSLARTRPSRSEVVETVCVSPLPQAGV
jgi:hypothetical protein